jgi:TonB family protein
VSVKPVPATSSADVSDAISDTAVTVFPQAIQRVEPEYPFLASKMNASGEVVLTATVNERGEPENLKFVEGNELFRQAAIDAASRWKYRPGTYNGRPVGMPVKIHLRFSSRFSASELESSQDLIRKEGTE